MERIKDPQNKDLRKIQAYTKQTFDQARKQIQGPDMVVHISNPTFKEVGAGVVL